MAGRVVAEAAAGTLDRRSLMLGSLAAVGAAVSLTGCASLWGGGPYASAETYGPRPSERFPIPAVDVSKVNPDLLRRVVSYPTDEPVGTIVADLPNYHLYRIEGSGRATRYGINRPRDPFLWSGVATIRRKAEWPVWTPTRDQVSREPELVRFAGGMPPGLDNPLGARALYLYQDGVDTLCRIYGTDQEWTIGQGVSSGCIGLLNQDIIDLYERTPVDTRVLLLPMTA